MSKTDIQTSREKKSKHITFRVDDKFIEMLDELVDHLGVNRTKWLYEKVAEDRERQGLNQRSAAAFIQSLLDKFGADTVMEIAVSYADVLSVKIGDKPMRVDPNFKNGDLSMYTAGDGDKEMLYLDDQSSGVHLRVAEIATRPENGTVIIKMPMSALSSTMQSLDAQADAPEGTLKR